MLGTRTMTGIEEISSGGYADVIISGTGSSDRIDLRNIIITEGDIAEIRGGNGNDTIYGSAVADMIDGGKGDDRISGGAGDDTISGGAGADYLDGGKGNDIVRGGAGDDTIVASGGDWLFGDDGNDIFLAFANNGFNDFDGGTGVNVINAAVNGVNIGANSLSNIQAINSAGFGNVRITVGSEDTIDFSNVELIGITKLSTTVDGGSLIGSAGADFIEGKRGADILSGGGGDDILSGGAGEDILTGGAGADTFLFASISSASLGSSVDLVTDFSRQDGDKLAFSKAVFNGLGAVGALTDDAFHTGTSAQDAADRIIYDEVSGNLYYNPDGTGRRAQVLVATIGATDHPALAFDDFLIMA